MATGARATVNQIAQIGMEVTAGTSVAATKQFNDLTIQPNLKFNQKTIRAEGKKFPSLVIPGKQWSELKVSGPLSYTNLVYWLCSAHGIVTPTTHPSGTTSKDWTFTDALTGLTNAQTFTIEKGDASRASKYTYGLVNGYDIKWNRDSVDFQASLFAQRITDNITLTGSLSPLAQQQVQPDHVNVYMDSTAGNIGTTLLADVLEGEFQVAGLYAPAWYVNRSNASYGKHVDLDSNDTLKISLEADSVGMSPLANAQIGAVSYFQVDAQGPIIESAIVYEYKNSFAGKCIAINAFGDKDNIYYIEWTFQVIDDPTLTYAHKTVVTNTLTAL